MKTRFVNPKTVAGGLLILVALASLGLPSLATAAGPGDSDDWDAKPDPKNECTYILVSRNDLVEHNIQPKQWEGRTQAIADRLPKSLSFMEQLIALSLARNDASAVPFLLQICHAFQPNERMKYMLLLMTRDISGPRIPAFYLAIRSDLRYGMKLLEKNDDPVLEQIRSEYPLPPQ